MSSVRKAVITAAGHGTRQYPATNTVQKELIPLVDIDGYTKPTLQIIIENALASGVEEFCVIANTANAEPIKAHFRGLTDEEREHRFRGREWAYPLSDSLTDINTRLTVVLQETQEGYGHAVYQAKEWVGDDPFLLLLGDHVNVELDGEHCIDKILRVYEAHQAPVSSVMPTDESQIKRYGTALAAPVAGASPAQYIMKTLAEKPSIEYARANLRTPGLPDNIYLCIFGLHALTADIFDCLDYLISNNIRQNGEIQFAAAQKLLCEQRMYVLAELGAAQHDMGIPEGLLQTQFALALRSPYRDTLISFFNAELNA